jgi:hypothetical protein
VFVELAVFIYMKPLLRKNSIPRSSPNVPAMFVEDLPFPNTEVEEIKVQMQTSMELWLYVHLSPPLRKPKNILIIYF